MASAIRQMTGVGGDVRKIARLLQKKAPPGHMLAYINQEEADLLKARGGSGKPHADTGVPSFESEDPSTYLPEYSDIPWSQREIPSSAQQALMDSVASTRSASTSPAAEVPMTDASSGYYRPYAQPDVGQQTDADIAAAGERFKTPTELGFAPGGSFAPTVDPNIVAAASAIPTPREQGFAPGGSTPTDVKNVEPGFFENLNLSPETKKRLGVGGVEALLAAYQTTQAAEQARKAREDIQKVAQPYQEQGRQLIAQARSGELTPAAQQTLQAAQAQAAQGAQARGGVGAQQAMAQVETLRQQLLQQQYDYGLKVLGIGDNIAVGAIRAGIDADRYVNQLANSYANNIARIVAGTPTVVSPYGSTSKEE